MEARELAAGPEVEQEVGRPIRRAVFQNTLLSVEG
jgi:hypothetical protein